MFQIIDRDGRPRWLEDHEVVPDGARLARSLMLMDHSLSALSASSQDAAPNGKYHLYDGAGRIAGVGDIAAALKAQAAREDYAQRLSNAHKQSSVMTEFLWQMHLPTARAMRC